LAELVAQQLQALLEVGNYDAVKLLLAPVQEVDTAEAIGLLPRTLQALAFRLLPKDEAIAVYEYLDGTVQQTLLDRLRSGEVLELVEQMSPDDRVRLFDELPAKVVRRLLAELSPEERRVTAQLLGLRGGNGRSVDDHRVHRPQGIPYGRPGPGDRARAGLRHRNGVQPLRDRCLAPPHRHPVPAGPGDGRSSRIALVP
jgi:hypothetical protein